MTKPDIPNALMGQYMDYIQSLNQSGTNGNPGMPPNMSHGDQNIKRMQSMSASLYKPHISHNGIPSLRPNYEPISASPSSEAYQQQESINGNIHVLVAPTIFEPATPNLEDASDSPNVYNIFSAFPDLRTELPDIPLSAFPAVDSKADTLTQSQMLADKDYLDFISAQVPEIDGLRKTGVFDIKKISDKPLKARLLSSIWSFRRKRSPVGKILKYKARLCSTALNKNLGGTFGKLTLP
jgi:hypothetical protein